MKKIKSLALALAVSTALMGTSAMAECTQAEFIEAGRLATVAVSEKLGLKATTLSKKVIKLRECVADNGRISTDFTYSYVNAGETKSVNGTVDIVGGKVSAVELGGSPVTFARRDQLFSERIALN